MVVAKKPIQLFETYTVVYYWNRDFLLDDTKTTVVNQGGTSSSKTVSIIQNICHELLTNPGVASVVADSMNSLERGALRDFKHLLESSPLLETFIINPELKVGPFKFINGAELEFFTVRDKDKAKHGKRDYLFLNEANNLHYEVANQLMRRTKRKTFIDFNPDNKFWAHKELVGKAHVSYFISNFNHNEYCPQIVIDDLIEHKNKWLESGDQGLLSRFRVTGDKKFYKAWLRTCNTFHRNQWQVYGLGKCGVTEGVVYDNVNEIDLLPDNLRNLAYIVDFGAVSDPNTVGLMGCLTDKDWYGKELHYESSDIFTLCEVMYGELGIDLNDLIISDNNPDAVAQLQRFGFTNVRPTIKYPGSRKTLTDILRAKHGHITRTSDNWINERNTHKFKKLRGEFTSIPETANDHFWDPARYWQAYFYPSKHVRKNKRAATKQRTIITF